MTESVNPQLYPTFIYRNKLLFPQYLKSESKIPHNVIDCNVEGDWLLQAYIVQLDYETFNEMPSGLGELGEAMWVEDNWSQLMPKIVDEARKHGWCVVQFYDLKENVNSPRWRVYSQGHFTDWLRETDADNKVIRAGAKFKWSDDLGNSDNEECRFDDESCTLVKFREGDGFNIFSFSDLSDSLLDVVFNARQIKGQMDYIGSKPGFKHYIYGESADGDSIIKLDEQLKYVDVSAGVGAPEGVLKEIISITDDSVYVAVPIFDKEIEIFAGLTRLPVSYYLGQRTSGGLGERGELVDLLKVDRKKNGLFKRFEPYIKQIFFDVYSITLGELELPLDETLNSVENGEKTDAKENQTPTEDKEQE